MAYIPRSILFSIILVGLLVGCGSSQKPPDDSAAPNAVEPVTKRVQSPEIDEDTGTYRGVTLGDPIRAVRQGFGKQKPASDYEPWSPLRYPRGGSAGPLVLQFGDYDPFGPGFRYYDVLFIFKGRQGLGAFEVVEPGARTRRGVRIGDPLTNVEAAYPELSCGMATRGEYELYPACTGKLGEERFIWFGDDPIKTITMSTNILAGVTEDKPFTGQVFELEDGQFVTYPPGEAETGDKIVCAIAGKRIEVPVPRPGWAASADPLLVWMRSDGSVRAECGGIHAETAPPGSW